MGTDLVSGHSKKEPTLIRLAFAAVVASAALPSACVSGGSFQGSASVSASADIKLPIARMPAKYASWVVEAEGYLQAVNQAYDMNGRATADLAAALGVEANANAIASFIHSAIQVKTTLECQPPRFNAGLVGECTASANARAAGNGSASNCASAACAIAGFYSNVITVRPSRRYWTA